MTHVKDGPKFKCNIYSDIDVHSAISVSSVGNSRSFTVLTDRLAFVNFSSPAIYITRIMINNRTPRLKSKNQNRRAALGRPAVKLLGASTSSLRSTNPRP